MVRHAVPHNCAVPQRKVYQMKGAAACLLCTRHRVPAVVRRTRATAKTGPARIFREPSHRVGIGGVARGHQRRPAGRGPFDTEHWRNDRDCSAATTSPPRARAAAEAVRNAPVRPEDVSRRSRQRGRGGLPESLERHGHSTAYRGPASRGLYAMYARIVPSAASMIDLAPGRDQPHRRQRAYEYGGRSLLAGNIGRAAEVPAKGPPGMHVAGRANQWPRPHPQPAKQEDVGKRSCAM